MKALAPLSAALLAAALATVPCWAQVPRDSWIVAASQDYIFNTGPGGLYWLSPDLQTFVPFGNQTVNTDWANCAEVDADTGIIYFGTPGGTRPPNPSSIFAVAVSGPNIVQEVQIAGPVGGYVSALTIVGDRVYYIATGAGSDRAEIGWVPKTGGGHTVLTTVQAGQHSGLGNALTSNGRDLFIGMSLNANSTDAHNIFAIDIDNPSTLRPLALLPNNAYPGQMDIARDGSIAMADNRGFLHLVDPKTGALTTLLRSPQGSGNGFGVNPYQDVAMVVPGLSSTIPPEVHQYDFATGMFVPGAIATMPGGLATDVSAAVERPVEYYGTGCAGSSGTVPEVGIGGFPEIGTTITFEVSNADPVTGALLLVGVSNTTWGMQSLPFNLGVIGGTGCELLVSADVVAPLQVTSNSGAASLPLALPNSPALSGSTAYAQWLLIANPTVNPLGIAMSDAVCVRIR